MPTTDVIIAYDNNPQHLCNSNTGSTTVNVNTPVIYRDNLYSFDVQIYKVYPATLNLSGITEYRLGLGNLNSTPLVESTTVNTSNAASGGLVFSVNAHSATLDTFMGTTYQKTIYCELQCNNSSDVTTLALFPMYVRNTVYST